jgi:hypothetical protein
MSNRLAWIFVAAVAGTIASFIAFLHGVRADENVEQGHGVICDTVEEVEHFAQLGGGVKAIEEINKAEKNACALLVIAFVRGKGVKDIRTNAGTATITEVLVVAYHDKGWHDLKPMMQYTLFMREDEDAWLGGAIPVPLEGGIRARQPRDAEAQLRAGAPAGDRPKAWPVVS